MSPINLILGSGYFSYKRHKLEPYHEFWRWVSPIPNPALMAMEESELGICNFVLLPFCNFNEYVHGPRTMGPTKEQLRNFEIRKVPWLHESSPSFTCKCGILATPGVIAPSLVMDGFVAMHSRSIGILTLCCCRGGHAIRNGLVAVRSLGAGLGRMVEPHKSRPTKELKDNIREEYYVPLPESDGVRSMMT
ncbi:hypothetical protein HU200_046996 [Digitaria exilis]|uniref:Uncharacterized protein n=1 Tax=Digitaria exilis TaxID=1010633 RepID=A0A835EAM6_9POAL|nr:hypothetical protein HU200_046996 [Digitaria exilis]